MIKIYNQPAYVSNGAIQTDRPVYREGSMAYKIMKAHDKGGAEDEFGIVFDAIASHDITYVGIIQTARASGMQAFPLPYVLTNCHNSLCAVGGTINEDDHRFGLSAAKKYGGEFVPAHQAVIHQYMREMYAGCGKMILASDSHTRYGALGTMGIGEGGPELAKQLLGQTYRLKTPPIVGVYLTGKLPFGVGPHDVALLLVGATFPQGLVTNKVLEFFGPGVAGLSMDTRLGIDVMTTETACLSSVWETDQAVADYLAVHGRADQYSRLAPEEGTVYDMIIHIDLDKVRPMIALPFHPSNAFTIAEFKANSADILHECDRQIERQTGRAPQKPLSAKLINGALVADQGVIAGCAGGLYENVVLADALLKGGRFGNGSFGLSVYPASMPVALALSEQGVLQSLMEQGAVIRTAFCGPCFGAGDVPAHGELSLRHSTRNFPNREGSRPGDGQEAYVALMDARSIAATAANGGVLTGADEMAEVAPKLTYDAFHSNSYEKRVYRGVGMPKPEEELVMGPNITDWPEMIALPEDLVLTVASALYDPVTTTDELIPSGETSSYRSNPLKLSEFALSRRDPAYVGRAKAVFEKEMQRRKDDPAAPGLGTVVFALRPGDGSAREQAASCQRTLGGVANIAAGYATRRYRSNLINWGMLPFEIDDAANSGIEAGDTVEIKGIRTAVSEGAEEVNAVLVHNGERRALTLRLPGLTQAERHIILAGCLMNTYK
ncbi:MAG: hydratase [Clostridia bacterium]|nr:hydratase [Clostridia bacterium]